MIEIIALGVILSPFLWWAVRAWFTDYRQYRDWDNYIRGRGPKP